MSKPDFEVQPGRRFLNHSHESEQITFVFEGEGETIGVKAGKVIAIPSNLPHAAFTREKAVRAAGAWSPVMEKYKNTVANA